MNEHDAEDCLAFYLKHMERVLLEPAIDADAIESAEVDRQRFLEALAITAELLKTIGAKEAAVEKLMQFYAALMDLGMGTQNPILVPRKLKSTPPVQTDIWRARATVAFAIECLVRSGMSPPDAAEEAAKIAILKRLLKRNANLKTSSLNWRNTLSEGSVENDVAKLRWRVCREKAAEIELMMTPAERQDYFKGEGRRMLEVAAMEAQAFPEKA